MPIGTNFWNIGWHDPQDVFADGWENVSGDDPWNPRFLKELAPYTNLRFMDWDQTNNSKRTSFDQRTLKTAAAQRPVAYEWMIDLCNRTEADMWVTIPHMANWEYSLHLANLIRYGSDAKGQPYTSPQANPVNPPLDTNLKVYVEYSNETWNGSFDQTEYSRKKGQELNLDAKDQNAKGHKYHVYAAVRHFEHFEKVWGADNPRLITVIAGWVSNSHVTKLHLEALQDPLINPENIQPDAYAIAPYFGHRVDGAAPDVMDQLRKDIEVVKDKCERQTKVLEGSGMQLIAYEGGQHIRKHADQANGQPEMYAVYREYLDVMDDYFEGVFAHYVHVGQMKTGGAWGAIEHTGQPLSEAHKYRALIDYINE